MGRCNKDLSGISIKKAKVHKLDGSIYFKDVEVEECWCSRCRKLTDSKLLSTNNTMTQEADRPN